jgi:hypothetical protein
MMAFAIYQDPGVGVFQMAFEQIVKRGKNGIALHQIRQQAAADGCGRKYQIRPRQF